MMREIFAEQGLPQDLPGELTAFGISEQLKEGFAGLFRSHPPLDERIRALAEGPQGWIFFSTDSGKIYVIKPVVAKD